MQLCLGGDGPRLRSHFVGGDTSAFWIVHDPYRDQSIPHPKAGDVMEVRYREGGEVVGFRSEVTLRLDYPTPLLFLKYPASVERTVLRATPRIHCQLPCAIAVEDVEIHGKILDISSAGCQCVLKLPPQYSHVPFKSGDELVVNIRLPGIAYEQIVWGEVKNLKSSDQRVKFGLAFDELDVIAQNRLAEFLTSLGDP